MAMALPSVFFRTLVPRDPETPISSRVTAVVVLVSAIRKRIGAPFMAAHDTGRGESVTLAALTAPLSVGVQLPPCCWIRRSGNGIQPAPAVSGSLALLSIELIQK